MLSIVYYFRHVFPLHIRINLLPSIYKRAKSNTEEMNRISSHLKDNWKIIYQNLALVIYIYIYITLNFGLI